MRWRDRLGVIRLRWLGLAYAAALLIPLALAAMLGFVWLHERGWLLGFVGLSLAVIALLRVLLWLEPVRQQAATRPRPPSPPDWTPAEVMALDAAQRRIDRRLTAAPLPWAEIPAEAMAVVETVAAELSDGKRGALDFTLPEALLLIDRVALRYRFLLRDRLPVAERVSLATLVWLWRRQGQARAAWGAGFAVWRGVRLLINPAAATLREAERWLGTRLQDRLGATVQREAQSLLLIEAARAAVELYSGRLRAP